MEVPKLLGLDTSKPLHKLKIKEKFKMTNLITIELCAEDRARLDRLTAALEKRTTQVDELYGKEMPSRTASEPAEEKPAETTQPEQEPTPEAEPATKPSNEPTKETAPQVTIEDIRGKVLELTGAGKKDEVRAIIHQYATKVPDIPENKRAEVLEKLTKLEG